MLFKIKFAGGKKVIAETQDIVIPTDQSVQGGGDGSAPEPFTLFLASIGTCAGIYVLGFCQNRNIPTDGIELEQRMGVDEKTGQLNRIEIDIKVPVDFPAKYHDALVRVASKCTVKRVLENPPEIITKTVVY